MTLHLKSILRFTRLLLLLEFFVSSCIAQTSDDQLKQDLLKLAQELNIRVKAHDTTALKDIVASEYLLTGPKFPQAVRREQWLEKSLQWSFDSATITDISLSNWGEVAVLRSMQHFYNLVIGSNQPSSKSEAWVTDLWMKHDDRWQLVTRVSERLPQK
ncbi:MAG TPA: nuclear transport factor 2 family protein [Mucilaginibacter sp.]|jgi:hypothetical protein